MYKMLFPSSIFLCVSNFCRGRAVCKIRFLTLLSFVSHCRTCFAEMVIGFSSSIFLMEFA